MLREGQGSQIIDAIIPEIRKLLWRVSAAFSPKAIFLNEQKSSELQLVVMVRAKIFIPWLLWSKSKLWQKLLDSNNL